MKTDPKIIEALNDVLTAELTAINQYFCHSKMCADWGYQRLAEIIRKESIEEMQHADSLMDRILYFDSIPNMQRLYPVKIGETVPEQFQVDLALEYTAVERLNKAIALCRELSDNGTRELFEKILVDEEEHVDWLESQLGLIKEVGAENYLAEQIRA
mgnify:CR=1 FL=1